ncbi:MAG: hypothetical protein JOZ15_13180 [Acidobacteria bacterium]|nr:hypothetical protein [Acidobacteriota bacterium]
MPAHSVAVDAKDAVDPALFSGLHWRLLGPFRGGRVLAVTGVPGEPNHFYFGAVNGGVWESRDAGRTWKPVFDGQPIATIGAIAVAPSRPSTLYVGTGEADMRSDIAQGDGVYKSTDGGRSWTHQGLTDTQQIGRILVDPHNPERVFVAALGHPYGPNAERGVFRSTDGGGHWQQVLAKDADTGAIDLAFEPGNPQVVYAALWQTRRPPWNVYPPSNGPGGGLWKSTDGGDHWRELAGSGLPAHPGRIGIAVAAAAPRRVYAVVDAEAGGLFRSDDGGEHWTRKSDDHRISQRGWYFCGITVEPADADTVWISNTNLYRSRDGGGTFAPVEGDATGDDYHALWIDAGQPASRILGVDQGAMVSVDGGVSWSSWHNQPTAQLYHVATDRRFPYWVYGAQQDSGAVALPVRTAANDGITMMQFTEITAGGESDMIAPDPQDPLTIYGGRVARLDLRTEQTRDIDPTLAYPGEVDRGAWTLPLAFSRRDPKVLYFGNQKVFRTADGGDHWSVISPDLSREDPGVPATLDAATAADDLHGGPRRGVVYTIAPSYLADHDLWVGTDDGRIWRTRDEGGHWQDITPAGLAPWSKIGLLETSPFAAESAYAAVDRHRLDDVRPYLYRTRDGGAHWDLAVAGIPDGSFVNAVRADPARRGLLYAGTEKGVYVSFDDGDRWQPLQLGLPVTSVRDLEVHDADLVIATHGRGFWVLDDIEPLRQAGEAGAAAWLYRPAPAVRLRVAGFTGTPLQRDEPAAANPPYGAYLDYVLRAPAREPVTLEIFDAAGQLVRRYSSADAPKPVGPAELRVAPQWSVKRVTLTTEPGMHRFVWPLRWAAPRETSHGDSWTDGPWAAPGRYRLALTVDGRRLEQSLDVLPDPRLGLPASAYEQQLAAAREVQEVQVALEGAEAAADAVLHDIGVRVEQAPAPLRERLAELRRDVAAVAGAADEMQRASARPGPPPRSDSVRFVAERARTLFGAIEGADAAPSADARAGLSALRALAAQALAAWRAFTEGELAAVNRELAAAGVSPIASAPAAPEH